MAVRRPKKPEAAFMEQVVQLAVICGWSVYHTFDSRRSAAGFPDLILGRPPLLVAAELKIPGEKPRPSQEAWLAIFRAAGVRTFVWTPDDWPEIQKVLARAGGA